MAANECPISLDALSEAVKKLVGPDAPNKIKLMTARGFAPGLAPRDLVTAQFVLTYDSDNAIGQTAGDSLAKIDDRIAKSVLGDETLSPHVLGFLAISLARTDIYAEQLLLNTATPSEAVIEVAKIASERMCEIIANNQKRILAAPEIARSLHENPSALANTKDRVIDFLVRNGKILDNFRPFEDAWFRLTGEERAKAADAVELSPAFDHLLEEKNPERRLIAEEDDAVEDDAEDKPLEVLLRTLNIAQKVALATKGNRSARTALMRDTNRLVALAAITSPSITEPEVLAAAQNRTANQDVITHIGRDKKSNWVRNYQIKKALVENPKYPLPDAMKLVPTLNQRDMKMVAKSRNVPVGVRNMAANILRNKRR